MFICTHASAQRLDAAGVHSLVARSSSQAVHVERALLQRPDRNIQAQGEDGAPGEPVNPAVAYAVGCLIAGTVGTSITAVAGTKNVVNIIAGGQVVPTSQLALYTAVIGVVFGTFCAVGQALTPLYLHVMRPSATPQPPRQLEHNVQKVKWTFDAVPPPTERTNLAATPTDQEDMSVPASWLHRRR
jgi:hypothetical protein